MATWLVDDLIVAKVVYSKSAVMGANCTAPVLAETISGSEAPFTKRMNRTAKECGMTILSSQIRTGSPSAATYLRLEI